MSGSTTQPPESVKLDPFLTGVQGYFVTFVDNGTTGYVISTMDTPSITLKSMKIHISKILVDLHSLIFVHSVQFKQSGLVQSGAKVSVDGFMSFV